MTGPARVVNIFFRVTDKVRDMDWPLDNAHKFTEAIPELQIDIGDTLIGIEKEDIRNLRYDIVKGKLMTRKYTKFTNIIFIKSGMEEHGSVVFAGENVRCRV